MKKNTKKAIFYLGGGTMAGVFSGGVLARLQELDFYNKIEAIYAGSAGAMNAAYFLSKRSKIGSTIYFDDLTHDFIFPKKIPLGTAKLVWNRYVKKLPKDSTRYAVDIDYVFECIRKKPFFPATVKKQPIKFLIKLFNVKSGKVEYVNAKIGNLHRILKAACCVQPYYPFSVKIGGKIYADGTIPEPIGLEYLLKKYPDRKIVIIVNSFAKRKFVYYLRGFAEGLVGHFCSYPLFGLYMNRETSLRDDLKLVQKNPRVLLVCPPDSMPAIALTQDRKNLVKGFEIGKKNADKIVKFVG